MVFAWFCIFGRKRNIRKAQAFGKPGKTKIALVLSYIVFSAGNKANRHKLWFLHDSTFSCGSKAQGKYKHSKRLGEQQLHLC